MKKVLAVIIAFDWSICLASCASSKDTAGLTVNEGTTVGFDQNFPQWVFRR